VASISQALVHRQTRGLSIVYWTTTVFVALEMLAGGASDLSRRREVVAIMEHLGYPLYFVTILGFWKVLGGLTLLAPRLPRLKEWAYAGAIFELTGAAASHTASGDGAAMACVPLVFAVLAFVSWATRPPSRMLAPQVLAGANGAA
jgi:uncharacterized membrane protein